MQAALQSALQPSYLGAACSLPAWPEGQEVPDKHNCREPGAHEEGPARLEVSSCAAHSLLQRTTSWMSGCTGTHTLSSTCWVVLWHDSSHLLQCRSTNGVSKQRANVARTLLQYMDAEGDDIDMKTLEVCPPTNTKAVLPAFLLQRTALTCARLRLTKNFAHAGAMPQYPLGW